MPYSPTDTHAPATDAYIARHMLGNAEQAKATGGMVALLPRKADAERLAIAGGEPMDDIHLTIVYLGKDVREQDPTELITKLDEVSANYTKIEANTFSRAEFNPEGDDPCSVYLVGGSPDITDLFTELKAFVSSRYPDAAEQHSPYIPHLTMGYGLDVQKLDQFSDVTFDRLVLRWPGNDQDWPL